MIRITADKKIGWMDKKNIPAAVCAAGDTVVFETEDCSDGAITADGRYDDSRPRLGNPATGPLYVTGAHPGDLLKVTVLAIRTADRGFMGTGFGRHCFRTVEGERQYRVFDLKDGQTEIGGKPVPLSPMIGVIGTAPAGAEIDTLTPSDHGGNMDCTAIGEGAMVWLPVFTEGALLAIGDLHAVMGDGEVFLYGLETAGEVTVRVDVVKNGGLRMPAVLRDGVFSVIASGETLEACSERAVTQLYDLMVTNGWDRTEAGFLLSMKCDLAVCQTVNPLLTVRAGLPIGFLRAD